MNALTADHIGVILGGIASLLVVIATIRKLQLKLFASPRFMRLQTAMTAVVASMRNPEGSRTQRLIKAMKVEILDANTVSDQAIFARIDNLDASHKNLKAQVADVSAANDAQHAAVAANIAELTTEVSVVADIAKGNVTRHEEVASHIVELTGEMAEVKDRLTAVERKLP